ncbi:MAG: hypothetical protein H6760_02260 [Candidatus Nomurabacteria bacterium]|nr:MAG: hypothetical protein H6760_02260 [Candidatus Nomurabacteria bacterium]
MSEKQEKASRYLISIVIGFFIVFGLGLLNKNLAFFGQNLSFSLDFPANDKVLRALPAINETTEIGENPANGKQYAIQRHTITTPETNIWLKIPETLQLSEKNHLSVSTEFDPKHLDSLELSLVHPSGISYDLGPIYSAQLEALEWSSITQDGVTLWQRNPSYASIQDFYKNPPKSDAETPVIATFHAALNPVLQSEFLANLPEKKQLESSLPYLEGPYTTYTLLLESGSLHIHLDVQELNFYEGPDPTEINVFDQSGELIYVTTLPDDGVVSASKVRTPLRAIDFTLEGLNPGMYRVEVDNPDIQSKLSTNQQYVVLASSPLLVDNVYNSSANPLTLYTNSQNIDFPAWHIDASAQNISLDGHQITLASDRQVGSSVHYSFPNLATAKNPHSIQLGTNHALIEIDKSAVIAFDAFAYFNPFTIPTRRLTADTTKDTSIEYVLARYEKQNPVNGRYLLNRDFYFDKSFLNEDNGLQIRYSADTRLGSPQYRLQKVDVSITRSTE